MANKTATIKLSGTYLDAFDVSKALGPFAVQVPYQGIQEGGIDVPDLGPTGPSGTVYDVDFGSVAKATALVIKNETGQELDLQIGPTGPAQFTVPDGGLVAYMANALPSGIALSEAHLTLTDVQSGAGRISTLVVGDPV